MEGVTQVSKEDKVELTKPFSLEEVKKVVFEMRQNRAPGPDGFPAEFYVKFWGIIKFELLDLINDFHNGFLEVERLNYGIVTLVPKTKDAEQIQKFRPICLLNVSFKIITKVLMNRLDRIMTYIISKNQTAFLKNRFIMEGIVILHELLNSLHTKKSSGILFKVDFEKAYDMVDWGFIYRILHSKGFPDQWCDWVMKVVRGGKVAIKVNDEVGPYFNTHKGLRQGDPLSPLLFNLAAEALTLLVQRAENNSLVEGLPINENNKVTILQYADDTIFMIKDDPEQARNLKFILCLFEQLSGLKINFNKSEVFCIGKAVERQSMYSEIFTCKIDQGGMGILDLEIMNIALLGKWLWNLENKDGWWQEILRDKYLSKKTLLGMKKKPGDSHFWQGLMEIKNSFYKFCSKKLGDGKQTLFWEDNWIGGRPLALQFPTLFNITTTKQIIVSKVMLGGWDAIKFRRTLHGDRLMEWNKIKQSCVGLTLQEGVRDKIWWKLTKDGSFTVKSFYLALKMQQKLEANRRRLELGARLVAIGVSFLLVSVWKSPYKRSTLIQIVTLFGHLYGKLSLAIGVGVFSLSSPVCFQFEKLRI
uniref:Retrotransposon protein, putative, unclassified n=2 Tax=Oryza sativa subsp. japonica TaxID=39947 RepID=Q8S7J0_ORYSJ|nr:Putative retroelement [Oryza sativa Japonica Group]AAP53436.1 retrotransposon protein, putative, unclassified [Oryza sativa Japonica Group]